MRRRRRLPADHERRGAHRREDRLDLPRRLAPGEGGDRRGDRQRGARRRRGAEPTSRGVVDHRYPDDAACLAKIRAQFASSRRRDAAPFAATRAARRRPTPRSCSASCRPSAPSPYDTHELLARLLDGSRVRRVQGDLRPDAGLRHRPHRAAGRSGIVANQRSIVERRSGLEPRTKELQIGGVIYSDSRRQGRALHRAAATRRGSRWSSCRTSPASWWARRAERGGIIKDGAKMVNAVANSVVPKITVFVGNSYGAGNYAMCGKAYDPRFIFAWPSASIAVMGGEQASQTLLSIQLKNRGDDVSEEEKKARLADIQERYDDAMNPRYAAARSGSTRIIDPREHPRGRLRAPRGLRLQSGDPGVPDRRAADLARAGELEVEEGAGGAPVALDGAAGDVGRFGDLGEGEAAEEVPFDGLRRGGVPRSRGARARRRGRAGPRPALTPPAPLPVSPRSRHRPGRRRASKPSVRGRRRSRSGAWRARRLRRSGCGRGTAGRRAWRCAGTPRAPARSPTARRCALHARGARRARADRRRRSRRVSPGRRCRRRAPRRAGA